MINVVDKRSVRFAFRNHGQELLTVYIYRIGDSIFSNKRETVTIAGGQSVTLRRDVGCIVGLPSWGNNLILSAQKNGGSMSGVFLDRSQQTYYSGFNSGDLVTFVWKIRAGT